MSERRSLPVLNGGTAEEVEEDLGPDPEGLTQALERAQNTRREFIGQLAAGAGAAAVASTAVGCNGDAWEAFIQQHYLRLTNDEKARIFRRLERDTKKKTGVDVDIRDPQPIEGVAYGYALNLTLCTGCRQCEYACAEENNTSRDPEMHYIRVLEMDKGTFDVEKSDHFYEGDIPEPGKFYMPVQCHQCDNAPCITACPVNATWQEPDGIVVVDYDWCIGCRYCETACPYSARRFNFTTPRIAPSQLNPHQGYLSNRLRRAGVVEKCHYCLHRVREGRNPACLEACPVGARKFGNLLDPNSEVRRILETKNVYVFKEDQGTLPRFFYFFS